MQRVERFCLRHLTHLRFVEIRQRTPKSTRKRWTFNYSSIKHSSGAATRELGVFNFLFARRHHLPSAVRTCAVQDENSLCFTWLGKTFFLTSIFKFRKLFFNFTNDVCFNLLVQILLLRDRPSVNKPLRQV